MKKPVFIFTALAVSLIVIRSGDAQAQLLLDQFMSSSTGAKTETGSLGHGALSSDAIMQRIQQQGYSDIKVSPTNPQQYTATSPAGTPVLLSIEPATGQVIGVAPQ